MPHRPHRPLPPLLTAEVGTYEGRFIDLEISNMSTYYPNNVDRNGVNGVFGQINLAIDRKTCARSRCRSSALSPHPPSP